MQYIHSYKEKKKSKCSVSSQSNGKLQLLSKVGMPYKCFQSQGHVQQTENEINIPLALSGLWSCIKNKK